MSLVIAEPHLWFQLNLCQPADTNLKKKKTPVCVCVAVERRSHSAKNAITLGQCPSSHLFKAANYALPGCENMLPDQGRKGRNLHSPSILTQTFLAAVLPAVQNLNEVCRLKYCNHLSCYASFIISYTTLHCSKFMTCLALNDILFMLLSTLDFKTSVRSNSDGFRSSAKTAWCSTNCCSIIRTHRPICRCLF